MGNQFKISFGGGLSKVVYDEVKFLEQWVQCRNDDESLWTYYPAWSISKIQEIEKEVHIPVREPGISLEERRIR